MKKYAILGLVLILAAIPLLGSTQPQPNQPIVVKELSRRVIVLSSAGPMDNNVIALQSQRGIVIVDTHVSPSISRSIREKIEVWSGRKDFLYVIYTHGHGDHAWGSQAFPEATVVAHENCLEEMAGIREEVAEQIERTRKYLPRLENEIRNIESTSPDYAKKTAAAAFYKNTLDGWTQDFAPILPQVTFTERLWLDLGDIHLSLVHFRAAHSKSDILIHCPEEDLLLTGDLFVHGMNPSFLKTETAPEIPAWISALERVRPGNKPPAHVVSGHGDLLSSDDLEAMIAYFRKESSATQGKKSAFPLFREALAKSGSQAALAKLQELSRSAEFYLLENDLSSQGYFWLYSEKKPKEAIAAFKLMTELFPESWNAWDCLGEAYMEDGQTSLAVASYEKSLKLNPQNTNALNILKTLKKK